MPVYPEIYRHLPVKKYTLTGKLNRLPIFCFVPSLAELFLLLLFIKQL
jgi:hypothetical protein